jgi:hypothetical protein
LRPGRASLSNPQDVISRIAYTSIGDSSMLFKRYLTNAP